MKTAVNITIEHEDKEMLKAICKHLDITQSKVIRKWIREVHASLKLPEPQPAQPNETKPQD